MEVQMVSCSVILNRGRAHFKQQQKCYTITKSLTKGNIAFVYHGQTSEIHPIDFHKLFTIFSESLISFPSQTIKPPQFLN